MKRLTIILLFLIAVASHASEFIPTWSSEWDVYVLTAGCGISREYSDQTAVLFPDNDSPDLQISDTFQIRFHVQTQPSSSKTDEFEVGRLYLFVYSKTEPAISKHQLRINEVRIEGFDLNRYPDGEGDSAKFRLFYLGHEDSKSVWRMFLDQKSPRVLLRLSSGAKKELEAPAYPHDQFETWARILAACSKSDIPISRLSTPNE